MLLRVFGSVPQTESTSEINPGTSSRNSKMSPVDLHITVAGLVIQEARDKSGQGDKQLGLHSRVQIGLA